jgi:predicted GNAT superfamily acetyltransferase
MMDNEIYIRTLQTLEELEAVRKLEALVWSMMDSIPVHQTITAVKNGGFILGAFFKGNLIGFQYSFPGYDGEKAYLCSHTLGIHPDYRKMGIGERLKRAQKEIAILKGYDLITWTYDPLETVNGNLNLHKLGAVCTRYLENVYGNLKDELNDGIATDRFLVEWKILEPRLEQEIEIMAPIVIKTTLLKKYIIPEAIDLTQLNSTILVPVPANFQELKKDDLPLALKWREMTGQVFKHYLESGWTVTDLIKDERNQHQYLYSLRKR